MEIKKAIIGRKLYDVVSQQEFERRLSLGNPDMLADTVIERNDTLYRVSKTIDPNRQYPCAVYTNIATRYYGNANQYPEYSASHKVDFGNVKSSKEMLDKQNKLRSDEATLLSSAANKNLSLIIREEDSPALKLTKECLNEKHIDVDAYRTRFASNCEFSNAIRLLVNPDNHNISIQKMQMIADKFDLNFHITATDSGNGVPNPMGKTLETDL